MSYRPLHRGELLFIAKLYKIVHAAGGTVMEELDLLTIEVPEARLASVKDALLLASDACMKSHSLPMQMKVVGT